MMPDLATHLLEIIQNSIAAGARNVCIRVLESLVSNTIVMEVTDDGKGMSEETVRSVTDPFTTSRTTRKVGLGTSFLKGLTDACDGSLSIESEIGKGTKVTAEVRRDHIDLPGMGDFGEMIMICIQGAEECDIRFEYGIDENRFLFDTAEVKEMLEGVSIAEPEILIWIRGYINEGIERVKEIGL